VRINCADDRGIAFERHVQQPSDQLVLRPGEAHVDHLRLAGNRELQCFRQSEAAAQSLRPGASQQARSAIKPGLRRDADDARAAIPRARR